MPEQSLWLSPSRSRDPASAPRTVPLRRVLVLALTCAMTFVAGREMYEVLIVAGLTSLEAVVLGLFVMLFAWIAFSLVSTLIGFVAIVFGSGTALGIKETSSLPIISSRNALLLPTYNEAPDRVMARLHAICESVEETDRLAHFDFFILSDTTDPDVWVGEEAAFLRLRHLIGDARVFYRHRLKNTARKSGNISEWVVRYGGWYDHMIVLDADSLMTGDTIVRLVGAMEDHPTVGLIQTLPFLINGQTLFARIQQFAGRVYGPLIARGIAWWHGSESNYWGHNAIIRVTAFAGQAGLPLLNGPAPFGGHILSHDFVEAALLRRAGWGIHFAPNLSGSYEECPPTLVDYAFRDRRWCQGNLQHLGVLPASGLHWVSRLHLLSGIGSYITSPMWLLFLLVGLLISLQAQFIRPEYFTERSLFPQWPAQDPIRATWVFAVTMTMLIIPKVLGILALVRTPGMQSVGGPGKALFGLLFETLISALIAPVLMLMQSRSVIEVILGRDSGWQPQRREGGMLSLADHVRAFAWPTLLGVLLSLAAFSISLPLFAWMSPVLIGLLLAIPLGVVISSAGPSRYFQRAGLLATPEERLPPPVVSRANQLAADRTYASVGSAFELLRNNPDLLAAHVRMIPEARPRLKGEVDVELQIARAKIQDIESLEDVALLTPKEKFAALANRETLTAIMLKIQSS